MNGLIAEIREAWNIPPYVGDSVIEARTREGLAYFRQLVPGCDPDEDEVLRGMLCDYVYYAWQGMAGTWLDNYSSAVLTWQANRPAEGEGDAGQE